MGVEIERKFLTSSEAWRTAVSRSVRMRQGYLYRDEGSAMRVRIAGEQAHINIKKTEDGIHRLEYEYTIPLDDARELLDRVALPQQIDKTRHELKLGEHLWEIDEFHGLNEGLVVAEIELDHPDEPFERADWLGQEVSQDRRYFNSNLIMQPFSSWQ